MEEASKSKDRWDKDVESSVRSSAVILGDPLDPPAVEKKSVRQKSGMAERKVEAKQQGENHFWVIFALFCLLFFGVSFTIYFAITKSSGQVRRATFHHQSYSSDIPD